MAAVAAGEVDVVVAWHTDRLWRNVVEQQTFLAIGRDAGLQLVATPHNEVNPADADDDFLSTILAAAAQKESADKSRRMKRRQAERPRAASSTAAGAASATAPPAPVGSWWSPTRLRPSATPPGESWRGSRCAVSLST